MHSLLHLRSLPSYITAVLVCLSPFCLAHALDAPRPPVLNYAPPAARANDDKSAGNCDVCVPQEEQRLGKLLTQYQEIADNGGWPAWPQGKKLTPGANDARVPTLRQLLITTGDYAPASGAVVNPLLYSGPLVDAVKRFQERHGLNADGTLSKSTQAALAVPVEKRISQILATLTRLHNDPQGTGAANATNPESKFVVVNLPAYTLYAVKNDETALTMRVIIGNRQNHTPLFDNHINEVVFNPPWNVPARIVRNEMLPKLRSNPDYFIRAGFTITQDGEMVDPMHVNPDGGHFSFRQRSGTGNALGKIKFNMPDSDDIYLHSTASPKLFKQEDRALSHGCIRVENPRGLAHYVLDGNDGWNDTIIDRTYDTSRERHVAVSEIPVHLVYWTAFVDARGIAHFYDDVYNKDKNTVVKPQQEAQNTITLAAQ